MAEAAKGEQATQGATSAPEGVITRDPGETGAVKVLSPHEEEHDSYADHGLGSIFENHQVPTDEELMGISDEAGEEKKTADSEEGKPPEKKEKPPVSEAKGEQKAEAKEVEVKPEQKEEPKKEPDKPPPGYVPHQALAEARNQIKALRDEIQTLKETPPEPAKLPPASEDAKWKDFKVLSADEFDELLEDDPKEAVKYQAKLSDYKDYQKDQKDVQRQQTEAQRRTESMVREWTSKISEAVPGIYDEGSEVGRQLAAFAEKMGFDDPTYLESMTDPRTLIVPPGQNQAYVLGPGAAGLIKLLFNAQQKVSTAADLDKIRAELRPKIVEEVTKELTAKFKGTGAGYKSLTTIPGGGEEISTEGRVLTQEEWNRLPAEQKERMLQGE